MKSGETLDHYQILDKIGFGGMGEVFRARDAHLHRDVAIKVLPESFAQDRERVERFTREARLIAALNHPNIATVHGFEHEGEKLYLILELVPGRDLRETIPEGGLPVDRALRFAVQIAGALEAAHAQGILHRDLKPSNIRITPDEQVKILDFGLGKSLMVPALSGEASAATEDLAQSSHGLIVGTPAYMSPEQARGLAVDRRTDVWAFGCVLFEMLTGERAFSGATTSDILAQVLTSDPNWLALPPGLPEGVRRLLGRCLQKDPAQRMRDMGDAALDLTELLSGSSVGMPAAGGAKRRRIKAPGIALLGVCLVLGSAGGVWIGSRLLRGRAQEPVVRFDLVMPQGVSLAVGGGGGFDLDPAGKHMVFVGEQNGAARIYAWRPDHLVPRPIPGTEGAYGPFFSPDGTRVGFFAGGKLKTVSLIDSSIRTLCDAPMGHGGCWTAQDTLIFGSGLSSPLFGIAAIGGTPREVSRLGDASSLVGHCSPARLPGSGHLLFVVKSNWAYVRPSVAVVALRTGEHRVLLENASNPRYLSSGHLLFLRDSRIMAVPLDLRHLRVTGSAVPVVDEVHESWTTDFTVSERGNLAYVREMGVVTKDWERKDRLVWVDRKGSVTPTGAPPAAYVLPSISPDGRKIAVTVFESGGYDLWARDAQRGTTSPLVRGGNNHVVAWAPDGKHLAYASDRDGQSNLYFEPMDRSRPARRLTIGEYHQDPISFSPDGRLLTYWDNPPETGQDIWLYSFDGDGSAEPLLVTPANETCAAFSPDGRLLVYSSDESGRSEIYIQPFPGPGERIQVSVEGGREPVWGPGGNEVFFWSVPDTSLLVADISVGSDVTVSIPRILFSARFRRHEAGVPNYAISPDGSRFIMIQPGEEARLSYPLTLVLNWQREFERTVIAAGR